MSVALMAQCWESFPEGGSTLLLMLALADYASDQGDSIYPSVAAIARKTRLSERHVQRLLGELVRQDWLKVTANGLGGAPGATRNLAINVQKLRTKVIHTGDTGVTGDILSRVTPASQTGDMHVTQTISNHQYKEREKRAREVIHSLEELPPAWTPTEGHQAQAQELGLNLEHERQSFQDHHAARGSRYRDWDAAFRIWLRKAAEIKATRQAGAPAARTNRKQQRKEWLDELLGKHKRATIDV